jgi:endonuclease/exonuclease/phosphatase family metal-dependent hydrolase
MAPGIVKTIVPIVEIDNPKHKTGIRIGKDLSDHYPILISEHNLRIISYNLQFMFTVVSTVDGKITLDELTQAILEFTNYFVEKNADICCVQELFDNVANELMEAEMLQKEYVATARVGSASFAFFNGGVRTFVKKEFANRILTTYEYVYQNKIDYFLYADALVYKGVTHICFNNTDGGKSHIFNTHLQSYYSNREHYAEVTLAQCVELKKFIEDQKDKGIIRPNDTIIICGDFNIPMPNREEEPHFLFLKMKLLMGPQFTFLDYQPTSAGPIHTLSHKNSNNKLLSETNDMNVNLDMALLFDPNNPLDSSLVDSELSDLYCDIQLAISFYVRKNATLFSKWGLSEDKIEELSKFNEQFKVLIESADLIKSDDKNPIDNQEWLAQALKLLSGPGKSNIEIVHTLNEPVIGTPKNTLLFKGNEPLENLVLCKEKFNTLIRSLKQLHAQIHKNYIESADQYKKIFETSIRLNHILLNAGIQFFKNPNAASFKTFQKLCERELNTANLEFEKNIPIWSKMSPIFKGFLGLLAAISILPAILTEIYSPHGFISTFFSTSPSTVLTNIINEFEHNDNHPHPVY